MKEVIQKLVAARNCDSFRSKTLIGEALDLLHAGLEIDINKSYHWVLNSLKDKGLTSEYNAVELLLQSLEFEREKVEVLKHRVKKLEAGAPIAEIISVECGVMQGNKDRYFCVTCVEAEKPAPKVGDKLLLL
jgi:hypothetical protein